MHIQWSKRLYFLRHLLSSNLVTSVEFFETYMVFSLVSKHSLSIYSRQQSVNVNIMIWTLLYKQKIVQLLELDCPGANKTHTWQFKGPSWSANMWQSYNKLLAGAMDSECCRVVQARQRKHFLTSNFALSPILITFFFPLDSAFLINSCALKPSVSEQSHLGHLCFCKVFSSYIIHSIRHWCLNLPRCRSTTPELRYLSFLWGFIVFLEMM